MTGVVLSDGTFLGWCSLVKWNREFRSASLGYILVKRWEPPVDLLTFTGWQLVAGVVLTGAAVAFAAYRPRGAVVGTA